MSESSGGRARSRWVGPAVRRVVCVAALGTAVAAAPFATVPIAVWPVVLAACAGVVHHLLTGSTGGRGGRARDG